jgi:hypothetical protein
MEPRTFVRGEGTGPSHGDPDYQLQWGHAREGVESDDGGLLHHRPYRASMGP